MITQEQADRVNAMTLSALLMAPGESRSSVGDWPEILAQVEDLTARSHLANAFGEAQMAVYFASSVYQLEGEPPPIRARLSDDLFGGSTYGLQISTGIHKFASGCPFEPLERIYGLSHYPPDQQRDQIARAFLIWAVVHEFMHYGRGHPPPADLTEARAHEFDADLMAVAALYKYRLMRHGRDPKTEKLLTAYFLFWPIRELVQLEVDVPQEHPGWGIRLLNIFRKIETMNNINPMTREPIEPIPEMGELLMHCEELYEKAKGITRAENRFLPVIRGQIFSSLAQRNALSNSWNRIAPEVEARGLLGAFRPQLNES